MASFEEFLLDYEKKESENIDKFLRKITRSNFSFNDYYPARNRFHKLKDPISLLGPSTIWSQAPFFGSTIVPLVPFGNKEQFNNYFKERGFISRELDKMIDLVKETGKIQFSLLSNPLEYRNLEFLEPLFMELSPPLLVDYWPLMTNQKNYTKYLLEYKTLANFGFERDIHKKFSISGNRFSREFIQKTIEGYSHDFIALKLLGYHELTDYLGELMITDFTEAERLITLFGLVFAPVISSFKAMYCYDLDEIKETIEKGKEFKVNLDSKIPHEIGKFILNKLVKFPENENGFWEIIQLYEDYELLKILNSLNESVKKQNICNIKKSLETLNEILENSWKETETINKIRDITTAGTISIGLIGDLAAGLNGLGFLTTLGFSAIDRLVGSNTEFIGEKIAKLFVPDHLITIYDFKKQHNLK